jgi:glucose/mannose-6-phosphate isomerase
MTAEQHTPILDDPAAMQALDKKNMLKLLHELPEQCETALGIGRGFAMEPVAVKPNVILLVGVGDSGLAADMACEALAEETEVPVVSRHVSDMPACIGSESIVFVIDYTGNSRTALRAYRAAQECGATTICVTSGGRLRAAAGGPARVLSVPSGQPSRCAIGYLTLVPVAAIEKIGLAVGAIEKASHAIKLLKNTREFLRPDTRTSLNTAKQIASAIFGRAPVIYGGAGYRSLVAARWKSQIGANGKAPACKGTFPDIVDGEVCAWDGAGEGPCAPTFVFLTDAFDRTNENMPLMEAAEELLRKFGVTRVEMKGATTVERMLYGAYLGDYVSYYLAMMRGIDPSEMAAVSFINEWLASTEAPRKPTQPSETEARAESGSSADADASF